MCSAAPLRPSAADGRIRTAAEDLAAMHTPSAAEPVMRLRGVCKDYRLGEVEVHALREIDLDLPDREFIVILGASGSGKSTLLNILGGLDVPTRGEVRYRDHVLSAARDRALTRYRREHVGFVFQFFNLLPSLTALENVEMVAEIAASPMPPRMALELVGLAERMNHFPSQLSGGEQQRVAIARALAKRPDVLLCDEPTGSLDYPTGKRVLRVLEQANRDLGTLVVVITHNAAIADMAHRVVRLSSGRIAEIRLNAARASVDQISW